MARLSLSNREMVDRDTLVVLITCDQRTHTPVDHFSDKLMPLTLSAGLPRYVPSVWAQCPDLFSCASLQSPSPPLWTILDVINLLFFN
jgi:hypothetical protein